MQWNNPSMGVRKHRAKGSKGRKGSAVACAVFNRMAAKPKRCGDMCASMRELLRNK